MRKLRILVAPLDWGLGHTTRCIPVINALRQRGAAVLIAGNKVQQKLLAEEFPDCTFLELDGYGVAYSRSKEGFLWKLLQQLPRISAVIKKENRWLEKIIISEGIDGVISDNRFGLFTEQVPSVFITHQLQIQTGLGRLSNKIVRLLNYRYINRFHRLWIPDFEGEQNLAGVLAHPASMPSVGTSYLGSLTRFKGQHSLNKRGYVLFIFSGPEPQRSIFEQQVLKQLTDVQLPVTIIRGKPLEKDVPSIDNVTVYNHLPASEMEDVIRAAAIVVCRSGYSSVMDINALAQKSILIPTPGQTEQEYLAGYLMERGFAIAGDQSDFNLAQLLQKAEGFPFRGFIPSDETLLGKAMDAFLSACRLKNGSPGVFKTSP